MEDKRVGVVSSGGSVYSSGIGQICIPPNVDRNSFVQSCLTTGFVSVQPQQNSAIHRIRCDKWILQQIDFPKNSKEFGSYVVFVNEPKSKQPFVIAHFNSLDEYNDLNENQFRLFKQTKYGTVGLVGDGSGRMSISIVSEKDKQGRFDISLSNPDSTAQFNINIKGSTNIYSSGVVSVSTNDEIRLEATDGTDASTISITKDRISNDSGEEPMMLGQSTVDLLREFINLVATSTNAGGALSNASNISALAQQLDSLLSQKSNLE
jgi:hypothetical protein